ncbi:MAG: OmpA family protein [Phycisphaerae bacterium]|nr:OmpA family protein [Phycisphaerae bacterium]
MPRRARDNNANAEDEQQGPPGWIVSFSDMVTLLLAFFVLLQSFATIQEEELFYVGQGSFRRAVSGFGIPKWIYGKEARPRHQHVEVKHPTPSDPDNPAEQRAIDPKDARIRQLFREIAAQARARSEDVEQTDLAPSGPAVRFAPGSADLPPAAAERLRDVVRALVSSAEATDIDIYVVALAPDAADAADQWELSTQRAAAAAAVLRDELARQNLVGVWPVRALGGGRGNAWCKRKFGLTADGSHIAVAAILEGTRYGR